MRSHKLDSPISYYAIFLLVRYLPVRFCHWLGKLVVLTVYAFSHKDRNGLAHNLSIALDRPMDDISIRKTVRETYINYGQYMVDFFLIPQLPPNKIKRFFSDIKGEEILKRALAKGKGAIFLSAHVGNWEIGGSILRLLNYPLTVVATSHNTAATNVLVNHLRKDKGISVIEMNNESPFSGVEILRHLRNNEIVAMNGDRDFFGRGRPVTFLGRKVFFPVGPVIMAMKSGAAIIPSFVLKQQDGRYVGVLEKAIPLSQNGNMDDDIEENLAKTARIFEKYIRHYPDQWYCPDPFTERITT
jgi:KDO2-lipid IV(A) lauroyltransferase